MLESLDEYSKELVYLGLKKLIESADGDGFHNSIVITNVLKKK